ncbi:hypothetical protein TrCOL_g7690 [Triparma columacea]|uniref:Malic enzyme n=1 Tax=Triparma columacea TaxID=722753 RepID=A0A9W7GJ84_9STRA|nr:hypothetical protein TrCOL_g7690 [Triparma columacea]
MKVSAIALLSLFTGGAAFAFSPAKSAPFMRNGFSAPAKSGTSTSAYIDHGFGSPSSPLTHPSRAKGVVPMGYVGPDVQVDAAWQRVKGMLDAITAAKEAGDEDLEASLSLTVYSHLQTLSSISPSTFYSLLLAQLPLLMPFVYTPVVGAACKDWYGTIGHTGLETGVYIDGFESSKSDMVRVLSTYKESHPSVQAIVVTDGERILGLGDLGVHGMGIPVGKLHLYTACGGIDPAKCLPVTMDLGCNVEAIRDAPGYMGTRRGRDLSSDEFDKVMENFMEAAMEVFGRNTLIQFEDFGNKNAFRLLEDWRGKSTSFNDDIQGTASVVVGGLLASLKLTEGIDRLADHTFVFLGAGEAGVGIAELLAYAIQQETGCTPAEARKHINLVDSKGLVTAERENLQHHKQPFAHQRSTSPTTFEESVKLLNPTAIIGVSATPNTFTEPILAHMAATTTNPVVFALSNPTSQAECTALQAYTWTEGRCVFSSGSPFDKVVINGVTKVPGQGNNAYVFPGIGLGAIAGGATSVTEKDMYTAAVTLAGEVGEDRLEVGCCYPELERIREVSEIIATRICGDVWEEGRGGEGERENAREKVRECMWTPFQE